MGYCDTLSREDTDAILGKTLSAYYGTDVSVGTQYAADSLILCPRLNAAISANASEAVKKAVQRGHAVQKNFFLKVAMRLFIAVAFSKKGHFGCKYIRFSELPPHDGELLIMPGNMKIKVFDYSTHTIVNLLKDGFDNSSLQTEINIRNGRNWPYVLPLTQLDGHTYIEKLLPGCSIDRLEKRKLASAQIALETALLDLQQHDRSESDAREYCRKLYERISETVGRLVCGQSEKDALLELADLLVHRAQGSVMLSASHGDLQNGNIYVCDDGDVKILDWETFHIRSLGYDILTYFYKFRYRTDYLSRIDAYLADEKWTALSEKYYGEQTDRKQVLAVYLLEDLLWLAEESAATSEKKPSDGLMKYASEDFRQALTDRLKGH